MKIINLKQGSDEWLKARRETFNASETPALFGVNPWTPRNPLELAHLKYGDLVIVPNRVMEDGTKNEEWIREHVEIETGIVFEPLVGAWEEDERFRASFDGISFDGDVILEIKYSRHTYEELKAGRIPFNYWYQIQHQLLVSGAKEAILAAADPETKDVIIRRGIEPNKSTIDEIVSKWIEFEKEYKGKELEPLEYERNDDEWEQAVKAFLVAEETLKSAKEAYDIARSRLIELSEGTPTKGAGIKVVPVRSVRYQYSKLKNLIPKEELEKVKEERFNYRIVKDKR